MTYHITTDQADAITGVYNSDGPFAIPGGAIQISKAAAMSMARSAYGFGAYDYIGGTVVLNTSRIGDMAMPNNRRVKIDAVKAEALRRLQIISPVLTEDNVRLLQWMAGQGLIDLSGAKQEALDAQAIVQNTTTRIVQMRTATQAQLDSYDPATDPNWP